MPAPLAQTDLLADLSSHALALGLSVQDGSKDGLSARIDSIRAKWFLGGRKASYRMSCHLTESDLTVHFREAVSETSWGIPPPALTIEKTAVKGWERSGTRTDRSVGGSGTLDFARVREDLTAVTNNAGWHFQLDGGRMP